MSFSGEAGLLWCKLQVFEMEASQKSPRIYSSFNSGALHSHFYKHAYRAGFFVFLALLVHAAVYFKERTVIPDAAIYLFTMVRSHDFAIVHNRYIAVIPELLPWLAIKAGLSLSGIALLYSLSYCAFYFCCYLCCGWMFKNKPLALVLLLYLILFGTHTHYWAISEQSLGMGLVCVSLAASLHAYSNKWLAIIGRLLAAVCLVFVAFAHPLLIFAVLFALLFLWKEQTKNRKLLLAWIGFYFIAVAYKFIFYSVPYEANSMLGINNFISLFPDYYNLFSSQRFLQNCVGKYWAIPLSFVAIIITYAYKKQWYRLIIFLSFFLFFLLLVNVSFPDSYVQELYIENLYLNLGWFIALPLVYDVFPFLPIRRVAFPAFSLLVLLCLFRIWEMHHFYTGRVNWERRMVKKSEGQKWILESGKLPQDTMIFNWCIPYEIWLLSTMEQRRTASIVVHESPGLMPGEASDDPRFFMCTTEKFEYHNLSPQYFPFKDTTSVYQHFWEKVEF
jgi:hypothetical protein